MDYEKIYNDLCNSRKSDPLSPCTGYEKHHILPKSMGGSDEEVNLVLFTYREHYIAHKLLVKFTTGVDKYKMGAALRLMKRDKRRRDFSEKDNYFMEGFLQDIKPHYSNFYKYKHIYEENRTLMISLSQAKPSTKTTYSKSLWVVDVCKDLNLKPSLNVKRCLKVLLPTIKSEVLPETKSFALFTQDNPYLSNLINIINILVQKGYLSKLYTNLHLPEAYVVNNSFINLLENVPERKSVHHNYTTTGYLTQTQISLSKRHPDLMFSEKKKPTNNRIKIYPKKLYEINRFKEDFVREYFFINLMNQGCPWKESKYQFIDRLLKQDGNYYNNSL